MPLHGRLESRNVSGSACVSQRAGARKGLQPERSRAARHGDAWSMDEYATHRMDIHERLAQGRAGMGSAPLHRR